MHSWRIRNRKKMMGSKEDLITQIAERSVALMEAYEKFIDFLADNEEKVFAGRCAAITDLQYARFMEVFGKVVKKEEKTAVKKGKK